MAHMTEWKMIPDALSRRAGGVQVVDIGDKGVRVEYGGAMGHEIFPTQAAAKQAMHTWALSEAKRLERQAAALRDIAGRALL